MQKLQVSPVYPLFLADYVDIAKPYNNMSNDNKDGIILQKDSYISILS